MTGPFLHCFHILPTFPPLLAVMREDIWKSPKADVRAHGLPPRCVALEGPPYRVYWIRLECVLFDGDPWRELKDCLRGCICVYCY
jgi:hypothetical protein